MALCTYTSRRIGLRTLRWVRWVVESGSVMPVPGVVVVLVRQITLNLKQCALTGCAAAPLVGLTLTLVLWPTSCDGHFLPYVGRHAAMLQTTSFSFACRLWRTPCILTACAYLHHLTCLRMRARASCSPLWRWRRHPRFSGGVPPRVLKRAATSRNLPSAI